MRKRGGTYEWVATASSSICWFTSHLTAHNRQEQAAAGTGPEPETRNTIWISYMGGWDSPIWAVTAASKDTC